jgi:hypothetical protein
MKTKQITIIICLTLLAACAPSQQAIQTAIAQMQSLWTPVPTHTPIVVTRVVTQLATRVVVQTPTPSNSICVPIEDISYSDNNTVIVQLQAYVSRMSGVKSVSYAIPERLFSNTSSELVHITYTNTEGKQFSMRFIIYNDEFGWKPAIFFIDGQCWIDPPH